MPVVIGYCTNLHGEFRPAFWEGVRARAGGELPLGLYLPADQVAREVRVPDGAFVFTLNGFPYGGFHDERVKDAVYRPDWTDPRRAEFTLALAGRLAELAPAAVEEPTISTVPLGWKLDAAQLDACARALVEVADRLSSLPRAIRVCLEPEPGCALSTAADLARFFDGPLRRAARGREERVRRHLGACWDTCHHAVVFEPPETVADIYRRAGVTVGKMQISCALELPDPRDDAARAELGAFDEPRWLHQTYDGIEGCDDLPQAAATLRRERPWRSHFHVPVDRAAIGALVTTQAETARAIAIGRALTAQFEVETYTWSLLPGGGDEDAIARELTWARSHFP
jgi:hypothetical protein